MTHETTAPVAVPDGYVLMPKALTAENGAKALLAGEFSIAHVEGCHGCDCTGGEERVMPEHKYTGGPWRVDSTFTRHAIKSPSHDIALVALSPQHTANALLIAAAPDLLQALEYVLETHIYTGSDGEDAAEKARAAIAKALGQA